MLFVPLGDPVTSFSHILLLHTPMQHSHQFPQWGHFNHHGRSMYPNTPSIHVLTYTHSYFLTHILWEDKKASLVGSVIALEFPPPPLSQRASSAIMIIRKITLQIVFNKCVGKHAEATEEY